MKVLGLTHHEIHRDGDGQQRQDDGVGVWALAEVIVQFPATPGSKVDDHPHLYGDATKAEP